MGTSERCGCRHCMKPVEARRCAANEDPPVRYEGGPCIFWREMTTARLFLPDADLLHGDETLPPGPVVDLALLARAGVVEVPAEVDARGRRQAILEGLQAQGTARTAPRRRAPPPGTERGRQTPQELHHGFLLAARQPLGAGPECRSR